MRGSGFLVRDPASGASRSPFSPIENPSDRFEVAVGFLLELPDFEGSDDLLRAARLAGAMSMLARAGFRLVLRPGAAAPIRRATRRRWWRRPE